MAHETKLCGTCNELKSIKEYYKCTQNTSGLRHQCISCFRNKYVKLKPKKELHEYCEKNKNCNYCGITKSYIEYTIIVGSKTNGLYKYCKACCVSVMNQHEDFKQSPLKVEDLPIIRYKRDRANQDFRKYFINKEESGKDYQRKRSMRPKVKAQFKILNEERKKSGKLHQYRQTYYKNKPQAKIAANMRSRIRGLLIRASTRKKYHTHELIGCSWVLLKQHLESLFKEGMSWDNYGQHGWHIDHIIPCNSFDLTKEEEQRKCFHYTNLQPLWALENILKRDKIL